MFPISVNNTSTQLPRPETWLFPPHYFWHPAKSCQTSLIISQIYLVISSSSTHYLSSDQYHLSPMYHSVSCPASSQGSHNHLSVDATQVRSLPCLKSVNHSLCGGRGKWNARTLSQSWFTFPVLSFACPSLNSSLQSQCITYTSPQAEPVPHLLLTPIYSCH